MRQVIVAEIRRLAAENGGQPPGSALFRNQTGIAEGKWRGIYWARWGDALVEAGFEANEWQGKLDSDALIRRVAHLAQEHGKILTYSELQLMRRQDPSVPSPKTLATHFDGQAGLLSALSSFCLKNEGFADVLSMLPDVQPKERNSVSQPAEGWVYLLRSGTHHKIGRSDQLEDRVKRISIALPEATTLVHSIRTDDPSGIEAYWHRRFADQRANGEWFRLTAADVAAFCRRKFQ